MKYFNAPATIDLSRGYTVITKLGTLYRAPECLKGRNPIARRVSHTFLDNFQGTPCYSAYYKIENNYPYRVVAWFTKKGKRLA